MVVETSFDPAKLDFMQRWASENHCFIQIDGVCGFGRPCVGLAWANHYVDFSYMALDGDYELMKQLPPSPEDAYHKDDCVCVLIQPTNWDDIKDEERCKALEQLYEWITALNEKGWGVEVGERHFLNTDPAGQQLEALLHGTQQARLVLK